MGITVQVSKRCSTNHRTKPAIALYRMMKAYSKHGWPLSHKFVVLQLEHENLAKTQTMFSSVATAALGFPRMGPKRELKFALEKYWKGTIDREELTRIAHAIEEQSWQLQADAGIGRITVGDYCLYDNVVTWLERLGLVPERFGTMEHGMDRMFAMARGVEGATALSK